MNEVTLPWSQPDYIYNTIKNSCGWVFDYMYDKARIIRVKKLNLGGEDIIKDVEHAFREVIEHLQVIRKIYVSELLPNLQLIYSYRRGNITKLELAKVLNNRKMTRALDKIEDNHLTLTTRTSQFERRLSYDFAQYLTEIYRQAFNYTIPVYNQTTIRHLNLVQVARKVTNNAEIERHLAELDSWPSNSLTSITQIAIDDYYKIVKEFEMNLVHHGSAISVALDALRKHLQEYSDDSEMKGKFFA